MTYVIIEQPLMGVTQLKLNLRLGFNPIEINFYCRFVSLFFSNNAIILLNMIKARVNTFNTTRLILLYIALYNYTIKTTRDILLYKIICFYTFNTVRVIPLYHTINSYTFSMTNKVIPLANI